ncbi:MAG: NAD-dependent epimerase/dehydratase family protein [Cuniculiplasma divulgatum]|nr:MAG: NAD-dependent epimerase/dehydratase family protein [Cuniculiplasma divulgatum]
MGKRFLITGGEGFIGRNIRKYIADHGMDASTLDISGNPDYMISVTDFTSLMKIENRFDGIFHMAAVTSPPQFEDDPLYGFQVNANGTLNILELAKRRGIGRVVLASSSATYGDTGKVSVEDNLPQAYSNLYPVTKIVDEHLARYYSVRNEVECISLRYFNTYGPGENTKSQYASVIWRFIKAIHSGDRPVIYGDGKQRRDFIYVEDTARASVLAMLHGSPGESYNVGTGVSTTFNEIFNTVREEMHSQAQADHVPNPLKNYQYFTQADMTKTARDIGFKPEFDLRSGIRKMLQNDIKSI